MLNHTEFIKECLQKSILKKGVLKVALSLNKSLSFEKANEYALSYAKNFKKKNLKDKVRQEKSSKDAIMGKLVEEIIIFLLESYFHKNGFNYHITNNKSENKIIKDIVNSLKIQRIKSHHVKSFDSDIIIYNKDSYAKDKRIFILSAKGTTRERIGQFLSHLFLMDSDVLNAKYGKNKYEVIFDKEKISLKYAFVTLDWASSKDFAKYTASGKLRKTVKDTEVQLILDDVRLGGGIYVLNDVENLDGIGNFAMLVGKICEYLK